MVKRVEEVSAASTVKARDDAHRSRLVMMVMAPAPAMVKAPVQEKAVGALQATA